MRKAAYRAESSCSDRCWVFPIHPFSDLRIPDLWRVSMRTYSFLAITALWWATSSAPVLADGDPVRGRTVFSQCSGCHTTTIKDNVGPHLAGVFGRTAGTVAGFSYSKAMAASGTVWNESTLDAFLAAPSNAIPGTSMPIALPRAEDRVDVIAYLKTLIQP